MNLSLKLAQGFAPFLFVSQSGVVFPVDPHSTVREVMKLAFGVLKVKGDFEPLLNEYVFCKRESDGFTQKFLTNTSKYISSYNLKSGDILELCRLPLMHQLQLLDGRIVDYGFDPVDTLSDVLSHLVACMSIGDPSLFTLDGRNDEPLDLTQSVTALLPSLLNVVIKLRKARPNVGKILKRQVSGGFSKSKDNVTHDATVTFQPSANGAPSALVFGEPLARQCQRSALRTCPDIMRMSIDYVLGKHLDTVGIFRLSGALADIDRLRELIMRGEELDLTAVRDPHVVCGLFKQWLRELPDPLLTFALYDDWMRLGSTPALPAVAALLTRLPPDHRATCGHLLHFLHHVDAHSEKNRMPAANLATVFGPNILSPPPSAPPLLLMTHAPVLTALTAFLVQNALELFPSDAYAPQLLSRSRGRDKRQWKRVKAVYDYVAQSESELSFRVGDLVLVLDTHQSGWWKGELNDRVGLFPVTFCSEVADESGSPIQSTSVQTVGSITVQSPGPALRESSTSSSGLSSRGDSGGVSVGSGLRESGPSLSPTVQSTRESSVSVPVLPGSEKEKDRGGSAPLTRAPSSPAKMSRRAAPTASPSVPLASRGRGEGGKAPGSASNSPSVAPHAASPPLSAPNNHSVPTAQHMGSGNSALLHSSAGSGSHSHGHSHSLSAANGGKALDAPSPGMARNKRSEAEEMEAMRVELADLKRTVVQLSRQVMPLGEEVAALRAQLQQEKEVREEMQRQIEILLKK